MEIANQTWTGLDADTKPASAVAGARFIATDTGEQWVYNGTTWRGDKTAPFTYLVYSDASNSGNIVAKNIQTGAIDYSNSSTSPAATINSALANMTNGGTLILRGGFTYPTETTLTMGNAYTELLAERGAIIKPIAGSFDAVDCNAADSIVRNLLVNQINITTFANGIVINSSPNAARSKVIGCTILNGSSAIGLGGTQSVAYDNYVSANATYPNGGIVPSNSDTEVISNYITGFTYGSNVFGGPCRIIGNEFISCTYGNNLNSAGTIVADNVFSTNNYGVYIGGGTYSTISGNYIISSLGHGIYNHISAAGTYQGPTIVGNTIRNNGTFASNTYDGIFFDNATGTGDNIVIDGNLIIDDNGVQLQRYGINVSTTGYTNVVISNNNVSKAGLGSPKINLASGYSNSVRVLNNLGYNPVGALTNPFPTAGNGNIGNVAQTAAVPATTTVQTVITTPKTIVQTGGTVTVVAINGTTVATAAGNYWFKLGLGETYSITYSGAPTISVYCE